MDQMRMDPKHQFAAQYVLSRAANERREREAILAAAAMNMSQHFAMTSGMTGLNCSPTGHSDSSTRISTPAEMKLEAAQAAAMHKSPFSAASATQQHQNNEYSRLPSMGETQFAAPAAAAPAAAAPAATSQLVNNKRERLDSPNQMANEQNNQHLIPQEMANNEEAATNNTEYMRSENNVEQQAQQANNAQETTANGAQTNDAASRNATSPRNEDSGLFRQAINNFSALERGGTGATGGGGVGAEQAGASFSSGAPGGSNTYDLLNRYRLEQISRHLHGFQEPRNIGIPFTGNPQEQS